MIILIDAYNLLKQLYAAEHISDRDRAEYIALLNRYSKAKRHKIILVFDGGFFDMPSREKEGQVMIIYAGKNKSADQAIKEYLSINKSRDLLLVSADRELVDCANKFDMVAIDPVVFDGYVRQAVAKPHEKVESATHRAQKLHPNQQNEELDQLMRQASQTLMQKPEEEDVRTVSSRRGKSSVLSKKERKIMAKLSKL